MSRPEASIELPLPTNATVEGPLLESHDAELLVKYDHEHEDGSIEWVQVRFGGVLAFEYRQFAACEAEHIVSFREIVGVMESSWLESRVRQWVKLVGSGQREGGERRFQHFRIYFDDVACVDVAAETASIG